MQVTTRAVSRTRIALGIACSAAIVAVSGHLVLLGIYRIALAQEQRQQFMLLLLDGWWASAIPIVLGNFAVWTTVVDVFVQQATIDKPSAEKAALILLAAPVAVPYYWWRQMRAHGAG